MKKTAAAIAYSLAAGTPLLAQSWQWFDVTPQDAARAQIIFTRGRDLHVGYVNDLEFNQRAAVWNGPSAASVVIMHPPGAHSSAVYHVNAQGQYVGEIQPVQGEAHAALWTSPTASVTSLWRSEVPDSFALGSEGNVQVGFGYIGFGDPRALAWQGTSQSMVLLRNGWSVATGIGGGRISGSAIL